MGLVRTVAPTVEPLTAAELKAQARVDISDDDTLITSLIAAAREAFETRARVSLLTQTWRLRMPTFPYGSCPIRLEMPPVQSVSSITYLDTAGASQTLTVTTDWILDADLKPAEIRPAYGTVWPATYGTADAVTVTYVAGYGATAATVPQHYRQAILLLAAAWYKEREEAAVGGLQTLPNSVAAERIIADARVEGFA